MNEIIKNSDPVTPSDIELILNGQFEFERYYYNGNIYLEVLIWGEEDHYAYVKIDPDRFCFLLKELNYINDFHLSDNTIIYDRINQFHDYEETETSLRNFIYTLNFTDFEDIILKHFDTN